MGKAKIISIINYKGGVGKTVSAFNIAAGLNFLNGHSVLLIDLDPQCSLSRVCLRAYSNSQNKKIGLSDLSEVETINHVFLATKNKDKNDIWDFSYLEEWKKYREAKAKCESKCCEGGSMYPTVYMTSMAGTTENMIS